MKILINIVFTAIKEDKKNPDEYEIFSQTKLFENDQKGISKDIDKYIIRILTAHQKERNMRNIIPRSVSICVLSPNDQ